MDTKGNTMPTTALKRIPRPLAITSLGNGILHRAIVSLPNHMTERDRPLQERIVFFEAPSSAGAAAHLEQLLAAAWCIDTANWCDNGYIYNINSVNELYAHAFGGELTGELRLFEVGAGGDEFGVGPDRIHYARAWDVDFFVPPRVAGRLLDLSDMIEQLYADKAEHNSKD